MTSKRKKRKNRLGQGNAKRPNSQIENHEGMDLNETEFSEISDSEASDVLSDGCAKNVKEQIPPKPPAVIPKIPKQTEIIQNQNLQNESTPTKIARAQVNINSSQFIDNLPETTRTLHIVATADEVYLTKLNPWDLQEALNKIAEKLESVEYLRSGALLATCHNLSQVKKLLQTRELELSEDLKISISVSVALASQTVQGKVYLNHMEGVEIAELLQMLKPQGVIDIRKLYQDPKKSHIPLYVITFFEQQLPKKIYIGYRPIYVDPFYPQPKSCHNCCIYGHLKFYCTGKTICKKCGDKEHTTQDCKAEKLCCPNCKGEHEAFDKTCPTQIKEMEICKTKVMKNISYKAAREEVENPKSTFNTQTIDTNSRSQFPTLPSLQPSRVFNNSQFQPRHSGKHPNADQKRTYANLVVQETRETESSPSQVSPMNSQRTTNTQIQKSQQSRQQNPIFAPTPSLNLDNFAGDPIYNQDSQQYSPSPYPKQAERKEASFLEEFGKIFLKILAPLMKLVLNNEITTKIEAITEIASVFSMTELAKQTIDSIDLASYEQ